MDSAIFALIGVGCFLLMIILVWYHQKNFKREGLFYNPNKDGKREQ